MSDGRQNLVDACGELELVQSLYDDDPWACGDDGGLHIRWRKAIANVVEEVRKLKGISLMAQMN